MNSTGLSAEQKTFQAQVHAFARDVLRPAAAALDRMSPEDAIAPESPFWAALRAVYGAGFHTALIPQTAGGLGLQGLDFHLALEELGWGSSDFALSIAVAGFPFSCVATMGSPDLQEEWVPRFVADREARFVGCWAITEPAHGSDHFMIGFPQFYDRQLSGGVVATRSGDELVIHGRKAAWVSNGTIATHAVVYLSLEPERGFAGGGVAFVPLDLPGVSKEPPLDKLGKRALNQGGIIFDQVRIPSRYLLVDAPAYEANLEFTLVLTNAVVGAVATGLARAAFEEARDHARTRVQGDKPLCEHQLVQKRLFDMYAKIEASRALSREAIIAATQSGAPNIELSIAAKVFCTQSAFEVADSAVQLFGGKGLAKGCLIEKLFRDARAALIEDGSNDILALAGAQRILRKAADAEGGVAADF